MELKPSKERRRVKMQSFVQLKKREIEKGWKIIHLFIDENRKGSEKKTKINFR